MHSLKLRTNPNAIGFHSSMPFDFGITYANTCRIVIRQIGWVKEGWVRGGWVSWPYAP